MIRKLSVSLLIFTMMGCSSAEKRNKWSDKVMRVMIDPKSINHEDYVRIQQALLNSGKWFVVDRSNGFKAAKEEQERLHRKENDRYEDAEKYAMWGKMYGVGGIVVPDSQCDRRTGWMTNNEHLHCLQTLTIVDANTAEVITSISHEEDGDLYIALSWENAVDKMNKTFPMNFVPTQYTERLQADRKQFEVEAQKQKELLKSKEQRAPASHIPDQMERVGDND